jgi:hypothetical protein
MPDDALIQEHDQVAADTFTGISYYLDELARRDSARRERQVVALTWAIAALTLVNVAVVVFFALND